MKITLFVTLVFRALPEDFLAVYFLGAAAFFAFLFIFLTAVLIVFFVVFFTVFFFGIFDSPYWSNKINKLFIVFSCIIS